MKLMLQKSNSFQYCLTRRWLFLLLFNDPFSGALFRIIEKACNGGCSSTLDFLQKGISHNYYNSTYYCLMGCDTV